ncbi:ATP-grasp domain-containing protein [Streptomyces sp. MB09-01]|uniref:ATP-grasp domain-containing protein n=1 Tax=Streptomyces sp. MB09-01 TaxID=3028666 RepID=UPI0029B3DA18|nr:ATP-grasp domain-containing protein [Streptomyces sp. MB09-01]MDX3534131.1 ATP-grasp domain-containing protein [Streptomyces sp. MB09-01]
MKLLAIEASQNATYYISRYQQVQDLGAAVYVLNGLGTEDFWDAERYRIAGSKHIEDIVTAAKVWHAEEEFEGVLTFSESGVVTVAVVAEALGLPSIGFEAARTSRNKLLMRQAHERGGAAHPGFRHAPDIEAALAAGEELGYPLILKPTLGAASNFVFKVDDAEEMRARFADATLGIETMTWALMEADGLDLGPNGIIVEGYLDGHEHLIEALAWDDEVYLGSIVDRITVESGTFDDDVHHAPSSLTPEQVAAVHEVVRDAAHAQGLRRSVLHAEVRFHQGKPFILEIAIRPGGGGLDHMARISAGHDPIKCVVDVARGTRPDVSHYSPTSVHTAAMCLISGAGTVASIEVPQDVPSSVFFLKITATPGTVIKRPPAGNNILGFLGATGDSLEEALSTAHIVASRIRTEMRPEHG